MTLRICGVGSRETPVSICAQMTLIGEWIRENDHWCTSGHAQGADHAFEKGAQEKTLVYLPWHGFNSNLPLLGHPHVVVSSPAILGLVYQFHPSPGRLSQGAMKLMARNGPQVLGINLDTPVDAVICWRIKTGGTDQAIRIAVSRNIPVWNMALPQYNSSHKILSQLVSLNKEKGNKK